MTHHPSRFPIMFRHASHRHVRLVCAVFGLLVLLSSMPVLAQATRSATGIATVKAALERMAPPASISDIRKAPLPGFYQALVGGRLVYVSADGTWVMDGHLYDLAKGQDVSERSMRRVRRAALAKVPAGDFITFAPAHPKYSVTVFTDLDCAYCRVLHRLMRQYNALGIAVHYLPWPRSGIKAVPSGKPTSSYLKAVAVWCAKDRKAAFDKAMAGHAMALATCTNRVAADFRLGARIGVDGTPTVIAPDGAELGGFVPPRQLLQALQAQQHRGTTTR
ncbi:MAG TPA: DsbC family protein [Rhodanobacteraceae bacterium]